jgi:glutathione-specific gamma-glutamylcyclotransferase
MGEAGDTHWVFAYGSLIWRPGFSFLQSRPARLEGWHRSLCVYSHIYRGSPECLGLVFGLDQGGHCLGVAYEVAAEHWDATYAYLTVRELVTNIYLERQLPVTLQGRAQPVSALTYVVDTAHGQFAGGLSEAEVLRLVRQGVGEAGSCVDYVRNTADHLRELGLEDEALQALAAKL